MAAMLLILGLASEDWYDSSPVVSMGKFTIYRQRGAFTRFITVKLP